MRCAFVVLWLLQALPALAGSDVLTDVVEVHILPRVEALAESSAELARVAEQDCVAESVPLRAAYGTAFDAWITASHLRFGPSDQGDRAYALAFWPDPRGKTPKALAALITAQDPVAQSADSYTEVSIAARGFYALEFLLYDPHTQTLGEAAYRCQLIRTVTADIAGLTATILADWQTGYASQVMVPRADGPYRSEDEAVQEVFKSLSTGLQFTSEMRLGRPLGTFERPRPKRAEAWRSGRSARHVALSLASLQDLAVRLAGEDAALAARLSAVFEQAEARVAELNDPVFTGVAEPQGRIRVEALQQAVERVRHVVAEALGPSLGVSAGFNALDGD